MNISSECYFRFSLAAREIIYTCKRLLGVKRDSRPGIWNPTYAQSIKHQTMEQSLNLFYDTGVSCLDSFWANALQWRHNGRGSVSNHQPHDCLPNRLFKRRSKKTSKLRVTGLCAGNSPVTGEFPVQMASDAENVSIWWHHSWSTYEWHLVQLALMLPWQ